MVMEDGFSSSRSETFAASLRVLVVVDEPTWLKNVEKMLKKCSCEGSRKFYFQVSVFELKRLE